MARLLKHLSLILLLLVLVAGFVFVSFNPHEVPLWLVREFAPRPLGQWLVLAFVGGALVGLLLGFGIIYRLRGRLEVRQLRKRLRQLEEDAALRDNLQQKKPRQG